MLHIEEEVEYFKRKLDYINEHKTIENMMEEEMKNYKNKFIKRLSVLEEASEKIRNKISVAEVENKNIIIEVLGIVENVNNMLEIYKDDSDIIEKVNVLKEGIYKNINNIGIEEINPSIGSEINNALHNPIEAVAKEGFNKYEIIEVVEVGYSYKNKVIKEAKVIAAK